MVYSELYREGVSHLEDALIPEAALDARLLLEHICKTNRNTLLAYPQTEVSDENVNLYRKLILKRSVHVPLQYLTNRQEFMGLEFLVNENVLIPRQDTEFLVEEVLKEAQDGMRILDMCTGSGCILLSIMNYKNNIEGVGVDISKDALDIAKENSVNLNINANFIEGDLFSALPHDGSMKFDIIVSNPPYIVDSVVDTLMPEVREYEPHLALKGGIDGLDYYRKISQDAVEFLTNYGMIFFEIGYDQKETVPDILKSQGYSDVRCLNDYSGNPRVVIAKYIK